MVQQGEVAVLGLVYPSMWRCAIRPRWSTSRAVLNPLQLCGRRFQLGWWYFPLLRWCGCQEPVIIPPLRLMRLTAATLDGTISHWLPLPVGHRRQRHSALQPFLPARSPLVDNARFNLLILMGDGATSNGLLKKAFTAACLVRDPESVPRLRPSLKTAATFASPLGLSGAWNVFGVFFQRST